MISAITVLSIYVDMVMKPIGALPKYVECFDALRGIVDILRMGPRAVELIEVLQRKVDVHHVLLLELYPECAKFKLHGMQHVCDSLRRCKLNLSCFATERRHRLSKRVATSTS